MSETDRYGCGCYKYIIMYYERILLLWDRAVADGSSMCVYVMIACSPCSSSDAHSDIYFSSLEVSPYPI